jgi:hypothetical protein
VASGALSAPPPDLAARRLCIVELNKTLFRSHHVDKHPEFFGRTGRFRFDAPDGSYGVMYASLDPHGAFVESIIKSPDNHVITTTELKRRSLAELRPKRTLSLIDITTSGSLLRIGADAQLFCGDPKNAQLWSKALHDHPDHADGILYPSKLDPARSSVALFQDRAPRFVELKRESWYAIGPRRDLLAQIMEHYAVELIEDRVVAPKKPIPSSGQSELALNDDDDTDG